MSLKLSLAYVRNLGFLSPETKTCVKKSIPKNVVLKVLSRDFTTRIYSFKTTRKLYFLEKEALSSGEFLPPHCPQKIPGCTPFTNNLRTWNIVIIF